MTIFQLSAKRKNGLKALIDNGWIDGFKRLLTDLYPDNAHFIYELLQNAEDAKASEVQFILNTDSVEFEHNGSDLFTIEDVEAITSIGFTTKKDDSTSIGKFGIGFKAVFAYTSTPEIESGKYHFCIHDMVVPDPDGLSPGALGERKTRFVFPFDHPKKSPQKAREEIEKNLQELNESTLLFLNNIRKIEYHLPDSSGSGSLEMKETDENRIEISVKRPGKRVPELTHYLRFKKVVAIKDGNDLKDCPIAVAFRMAKQGDQHWKITPLNSGQVCIYFPAAKETSKLQFHLHAPFASTVARDSIRDDPANDELLKHIANLVTESMSTIRDQGLLNVEFLATLPNNTDFLSSFYLPIQERLIEAFNKEKLTPTKRCDHANALGLYRSEKELSDLIQDEDLATLLGKDRSLPLWVANPQSIQQRDERGRFVPNPNAKRVGDFLTMLDISEWTIVNFIEMLETRPKTVMEWLKEKSDEWHQRLYAFFEDYKYRVNYKVAAALEKFRIVHCSDGIYRIGSECHFLGDDIEPDEDLRLDAAVLGEENQLSIQEADDNHEKNFRYVAKGVFSSGQNQYQQEKARDFLKQIGVREVDEVEQVKAILKQRYTSGQLHRQYYKRDLERFIELVEKEPDYAGLFKEYCIFEYYELAEEIGLPPSLFFVDSPYLNTGLTAYYSDTSQKALSLEKRLVFNLSLSPRYAKSGIDPEKFGKFAAAVGVQTKLEAIKQTISKKHPEYQELVENAQGQWRYDTGRNEDYTIPEFKILLDTPSIDKSRLIWRTMCSLPGSCLEALYRRNQSNKQCEGHSSLVHDLRKANWVPQEEGDSIAFKRPCDALREHLPLEGFSWPRGYPHDAGEEWLDAIEFGKIAREQEAEYIQQNQHAKELGFNSGDEAEKWAKLASRKSPEEVEKWLGKSSSRERRKELLVIELSHAEEKQYEPRARSIRITRSKIDPTTHLRAQYTTEMNNVECQMCRQDMPFKKRNSDEDYFEAVEVLKKDYFPKEHAAQYLALCPVCAAKYKEFVKRDKKAREYLYNALRSSDEPEIRLALRDFAIRIWFKEKHWHDLKTVLYYYEKEGS